MDHIILAEKLKAVCLAGDMWKWINDYLSNRMQGTSVNTSRFDRNPIGVGVPQGSLLGPKLFASYVNDPSDPIVSGDVDMYADDTTIYVVGNTVDDNRSLETSEVGRGHHLVCVFHQLPWGYNRQALMVSTYCIGSICI